MIDPLPERRKKRLARWLEGCYRVAFGHDHNSRSFKAVAIPNAERMAAFSRTIVCGMDSLRNRLRPEVITAFPQHMEWVTNRAAGKPDEIGKRSATMLKYSATIDESIMAHAVTQKFCVTENGRFGQMPLDSLPGDCICVLVGGEVPFVIRPTGCGTYTLIGECYVDGIMDGETFEAIDATTELLDTIHLE
ncbi:hypothetical protein HD806DRAFT_532954 [Xylariaceae sp. AK1471]|nr:hypothetical protein HD806DRAFT_532954 [Xylariaceae sp. AK1471]